MIAATSKVAATKPERWQQIEALLRAASETSGDDREALLCRCEPEVRHAVEAMLLQAASNSGTLDRPASSTAANRPLLRAARLSPGEQLGSYRVEEWIGSGAMGDVYRATDVRLNRTVALKVLAPEFAGRFEREARAIAALNHPNICQIYDIGPQLLIMEYVTGAPVVSADKEPRPRSEALQIALQMAAAMEAAHAKGIIHRDLQPANILVTYEGVVKLLDFGSAKRVPVEGAPSTDTLNATVAGMFMGTPAYSSPETAEGGVADARSDIFSFGAIFYEMLSGKRAFPGESAASTLEAVMHRDPDPVHAPPAVAAIVAKCLKKPPQDRFQSAAELRVALHEAATGREPTVPRPRPKRWRWRWRGPVLVAGAIALLIAVFMGARRWAPARSDTINSIAVLPFDMQSNQPEAAFISDGLSDGIRNRLSRVSGMKVIPSSITQKFTGHAADFHKLSTQLGVDAVLVGHMAQRGDDLTIDIELDDVHSGSRIWAQQYRRKVADLPMTQNDISKEVSQRLRPQLPAHDQERLEAGSAANP